MGRLVFLFSTREMRKINLVLYLGLLVCLSSILLNAVEGSTTCPNFPTGWTCGFNNEHCDDVCDCNDVCGGRDPYPGACPANETALAPGKLRGCPPFANCCTNSTRVCGVYNNETAACDPVVMPPPEWTCGVDKWGDGVCDCGYTCGAWDLFDCENVTGVYTHETSLPM